MTGSSEVNYRKQAFTQLCAFPSPVLGSMSDMAILQQLPFPLSGQRKKARLARNRHRWPVARRLISRSEQDRSDLQQYMDEYDLWIHSRRVRFGDSVRNLHPGVKGRYEAVSKVCRSSHRHVVRRRNIPSVRVRKVHTPTSLSRSMSITMPLADSAIIWRP